MRARALYAAFALLAIVATPARAADLPRGFAKLRAQDALVQRVGYRLADGNGALCPQTAPATGLLLHDLATYGEEDARALQAGLALAGPIGVESVVPGSPAARAGIALDDTVLAIGNRSIGDFPLDARRSWARLQSIEAALETALRADGVARLTLSRNGERRTVELGALPACATRFEVAPVGSKAAAEGTRVVIGPKFAGFAYPEEEFAAVLAHELAHNILRHRALLEREGRSMRNERETEREADRMMPWLLANGGYDPMAAARFMQRFGPVHDGGIFRDGSHDGWKDRARDLAIEAQLVTQTWQITGAADWRIRFSAELARATALPPAEAADGG
ncbi:M48 family metallopeptidase [Erythrobacter sp. LQ02-29]|uniref:M48 family metallopeptidase n=1 Tax=Erythrobacter sp. LQ02-29 TaxID=2920384 RepID=UPI001F4D90E1|nr:M48 family metallopeptidase [Erythrobacter sp. LQ02-29]MCP9221905.1 M48 family metallopeptidase [Erythrobacter sp. LQ02-29]